MAQKSNINNTASMIGECLEIVKALSAHYPPHSKEPCYQLVSALESKLKELQNENFKVEEDIKEYALTAQTLQISLQELTRKQFGRSCERYISQPSSNQGVEQLSLFRPEDFDFDVQVEVDKVQLVDAHTRTKKKKVVRSGRLALPTSLPVEEKIIYPEGDLTGFRELSREHYDQLDYKPGKLFKQRITRVTCINDQTKEILRPSMPNQIIDKGIPGPGLLASLSIDKWAYHVPIHRQLKKFSAQGVPIPASTVVGWLRRCAGWLKPIYELIKKKILDSGYVQADETPIRVMAKIKKGKSHRGFLWVYYSPESKYVFFEYQHGRGREGPQQVLDDFSGYLQTDGYNVYDLLRLKNNPKRMGCMAHARRYFEKALDNDAARASHFLEEVQKLYLLERKWKELELTHAQIKTQRDLHARPIMEELRRWLESTYCQVLPKSPIGKAVAYSLGQWNKLLVYLEDGKLLPDNNAVENQVRPVAIGRKNYLFIGSNEAAPTTAIMYTILGTIKAHGIDPYAYLHDVFQRLPNMKIQQLPELLPENWKPKSL